ncbi:MAG TPA: hypothetical protein VE957_03525 [Terriglobales bacterium]|nr:hypothetical protein [Terriglobales bacterium]
MFRRMLSSAISMALLASGSAAHAGISEVYANFPNQTTALLPTPILTAPASAASYLVCIYLEQPNPSTMTATLSWTDENGNVQSFSPANVAGAHSSYGMMCQTIRNDAGTAPAIAVSGTPSGKYGVFVSGFGFWPGHPQKQGGISEIFNQPLPNTGSGTAALYGDYLLAVEPIGRVSGAETYVSWTDDFGAQFETLPEAGGILFFREANYTSIGISPNAAGYGDFNWSLLRLSSPSSGSGPLTDYEYTLLDWTNATYPGLKTVFTSGTMGANILLATNIAQQPNSGSINEVMLTSWAGYLALASSSNITAVPSGAPDMPTHSGCPLPVGSPGCQPWLASPAHIPANTALRLYTYNDRGSPWGASPTYSAEVDVIQF